MVRLFLENANAESGEQRVLEFNGGSFGQLRGAVANKIQVEEPELFLGAARLVDDQDVAALRDNDIIRVFAPASNRVAASPIRLVLGRRPRDAAAASQPGLDGPAAAEPAGEPGGPTGRGTYVKIKSLGGVTM